MINLVSGVVFFQANFTILKNILGQDEKFRPSQFQNLRYYAK